MTTLLVPRMSRRTTIPASIPQCSHSQVRHASLLKRPLRPYTFTQLITLSDGSTFTQRTTSPAPLYRSTKDSRNNAMWQPSLSSLRNVELDEAGRLRAFRAKFGRGWDADGDGDQRAEDDVVAEEQSFGKEADVAGEEGPVEKKKAETNRERRLRRGKAGEGGESMLDIIHASYGAAAKK